MNTKIVVFLITAFASIVACSSVKSLDSPTLSKYEGFIQDGKTTKQEIQDRLGSASSSYECDRILIYHVYLQDDGRVKLKGQDTCHACVVVFDKDDVLKRHSLVKNGCN